MLAARRKFIVLEEEFSTPLIVPSYSSRAVEDDVKEVIQVTARFVSGPVLVSAYDIKNHGVRQSSLSNSNLVFLDSGGYEAGKDHDFSEIENLSPRRTKWPVGDYVDVISNWDYSNATVVVSYDVPHRRLSIEKQIDRAKKHAALCPSACHTILFKPEPKGRKLKKKERLFINIDRVIKSLGNIKEFPIVGLAEKDLGNSTLERMVRIAKLRKAIDGEGLDTKIHIFGSLDPISTPLYFMSGADIFDGLTWLRYAYHNGVAIYRQNFIACDNEVALGTRDGDLSVTVHFRNYMALGRLQEAMMQFLQDQDFEIFGDKANFFENAVAKLSVEVGGH